MKDNKSFFFNKFYICFIFSFVVPREIIPITYQKCSQKGEKLNAHHILNYSTHKELRLKKSNGITFCKKCHKQFHIKYGIKNNNRIQLDKFLTTQ